MYEVKENITFINFLIFRVQLKRIISSHGEMLYIRREAVKIVIIIIMFTVFAVYFTIH